MPELMFTNTENTFSEEHLWRDTSDSRHHNFHDYNRYHNHFKPVFVGVIWLLLKYNLFLC